MSNIERTVPRRFPRLVNKEDQKVLTFIYKLRIKYPLPSYNRAFDGSWNPGAVVLSTLAFAKKKKLRKWADTNLQDDRGSRFTLIKKLYLHWRRAKIRGRMKENEDGKLRRQEAMQRGRAEQARVLKLWDQIHTMTERYKERGGYTMPRIRYPRLKVGRDGNVRFPRN